MKNAFKAFLLAGSVAMTAPAQAETVYSILDFKDLCARGGFLRLFMSSADVVVSDLQGNAQRDLIKHEVVFIKYLMAAMNSCSELHDKIQMVTTPWDNF